MAQVTREVLVTVNSRAELAAAVKAVADDPAKVTVRFDSPSGRASVTYRFNQNPHLNPLTQARADQIARKVLKSPACLWE